MSESTPHETIYLDRPQKIFTAVKIKQRTAFIEKGAYSIALFGEKKGAAATENLVA